MEVPTLAVTLGVIAIILGIMATIIVQMQGSIQDTTSGRTTVSNFDANNTFTTLNNSVAVDFASDHSSDATFVANSCTGAIILNETDQAVITTSFTVSGCSATLKTTANILLNNTIVTANYTYSSYEYGAAYNVTVDGLNATEDFAEWQSTWVVIIAAAIVIGIIGAYLMFKPKGG